MNWGQFKNPVEAGYHHHDNMLKWGSVGYFGENKGNVDRDNNGKFNCENSSSYTGVLYIGVFRPEPHSLKSANFVYIYWIKLNKS